MKNKNLNNIISFEFFVNDIFSPNKNLMLKLYYQLTPHYSTMMTIYQTLTLIKK